MGGIRKVFFLARVIGGKPFLAFGLVSLMTVALLAAVNVTSRQALRAYVEDQLDRVPWEISVYQTGEFSLAPELGRLLKSNPGITQTADIVFLRTVLPAAVHPNIDGQKMLTPWLSLMAASRPKMLPLDIRPTEKKAVLVLVGSKEQMGDAYLNLQNSRRFELEAGPGPIMARDPHGAGIEEPEDHSHSDDRAHSHEKGVNVFGLDLERVVRIDRNEFNRWFMDNTSSPTLVPEIGTILVVPHDASLLTSFDRLSRGILQHDDGGDFHVNPGEYFPEIIHLAKLDRAAIISGWDIEGSAAKLNALAGRLRTRIREVTYAAAVDNTAGVLLKSMARIAHQIGLITLLVSLPLLWMAWILLTNLSSLLLLNARRTFGLLRLRGVPGRAIGTALLAAIGAGGVAGGLAGAVVGTALPVAIYADRWLPVETLLKVQPPYLIAGFIAIAVIMALAVSRRLVRYAAGISPLEASGRVVSSEKATANVRFGPVQFLCLAVGGFKVSGWIFGWSLTDLLHTSWSLQADRALDFIGFPLFVYGIATLVASQSWLLSGLLAPTAWVMGGRLGPLALRHMATRGHRIAAFLLIVAMMASLSLYPTVMTAVFDAKTLRGAEVRLGAPLQITLNGASLMPAKRLAEGGLEARHAALKIELDRIRVNLTKLAKIDSVEVLTEGLVEGLYMPGFGFSGVPLYLIDDVPSYAALAESEPGLGTPQAFKILMTRLSAAGNDVLVSPAVQGFYKREIGTYMLVGRQVSKEMQSAPLGGTVRFLPGMPQKTVNERQSFVKARIEYLNYLFGFNPYLVASADNPRLKTLDALLLRSVLLIHPAPGVTLDDARRAALAALPVEPMEVRNLKEETARLGSDMYIFLARENFRIYMIGGLLLSLIGILAVAYSNYSDDRRILGLLRVRGCGPRDMLGFSAPGLFAPSLVGLIIGGLVALAVGYGITDLVWKLREILTVLTFIPTRLATSAATAFVLLILIAILLAVALGFSRWVFNRTAREGLREG